MNEVILHFFNLFFVTKRVNLYRKTKLEDWSYKSLLGYSFSLDGLFILIEGFWRLAVFNEA